MDEASETCKPHRRPAGVQLGTNQSLILPIKDYTPDHPLKSAIDCGRPVEILILPNSKDEHPGSLSGNGITRRIYP